MSSLTSSLQDLFASIFGIIRSIFGTIYSLFESVVVVFTNLVSGVLEFARGLVGVLLGNIVIIGIFIAALVGYSAYRQKNQGGGIAAGKKRI